MEFRKVKFAHNAVGVEGYEVSKDGLVYREIATKKVIPLEIDDKGVQRVTLTNLDGEAITNGIKSIYRWSYYKAMPLAAGEIPVLKTKKMKNPKMASRADLEPKIIKGKRGKVKSVLKPGKNELLSPYSFRQMLGKIDFRRQLGSTGASVELYEANGDTIRVIFDNVEKATAIVRITSQGWRNGYWFVSLATGDSTAFDDKIHRKGGKTGDTNIIWPKELAS